VSSTQTSPDIHVALRTEIIAQNGAKERKLDDLPLLAEGLDLRAVKGMRGVMGNALLKV
jgi:hypothetical protein